MTSIRTAVRTTSIVPADYAELFSHYYPYVVGLVRSFYIDEADVEDVSMTILTKFLENDALADYDPTYLNGGGRPTSFYTFLSGFVTSYLRHFVARQALLKGRHPVSVNQQIQSAEGSSDPDEWMDVYGPKHYDDVRHVTDAQFLQTVRSYLVTLPVVGLRDFALLFELIIDQLNERGRIHKEELASLFGVGATSIHNWLGLLQGHLREVTQ